MVGRREGPSSWSQGPLHSGADAIGAVSSLMSRSHRAEGGERVFQAGRDAELPKE